jgi:putative SOS response-associated peptidase YedK
MCGRFTLRTPTAVLVEHFDLRPNGAAGPPSVRPRYNIAPTQDVAVVRASPASGSRELAWLHWGLIPSWAKDPSIGNRMINARGETFAEKPSFRVAARRRRCLIPTDGFYEWQKRGKTKQPYYIHRPDDGPFAFAGLWEHWRPKDADGPEIESCTIVTTEANAMMQDLHERMPVILAPNDYTLWLDPDEQDVEAVAHLIAPCPDDELVAHPVSTHVNRPKNDDSSCIDAIRELF